MIPLTPPPLSVLFDPVALVAYIGPGTGLTAIGAFLALVLGLAVAFIAFVWYPLRRLKKKRRSGRGVSPPPPGPAS